MNIFCKHPEAAYWSEEAKDTLQITGWIPLLDTNEENGCLQVYLWSTFILSSSTRGSGTIKEGATATDTEPKSEDGEKAP